MLIIVCASLYSVAVKAIMRQWFCDTPQAPVPASWCDCVACMSEQCAEKNCHFDRWRDCFFQRGVVLCLAVKLRTRYANHLNASNCNSTFQHCVGVCMERVCTLYIMQRLISIISFTWEPFKHFPQPAVI